jgi:hypothetical protein
MTSKRLLAMTLAGGLIAAGAALWRGGSAEPPPAPTGTLAFSSPELGDVFVAGADGSHIRRLTSTNGPQFDPSFSPTGQQIAYRDSRRGINEDDEIWVMDIDGSDATNLTRDRANDWSPSWSPDGKSIAFASTRSGSLSLWTMATDGSNVMRLTRSPAEYPSWSPDGSQIALLAAVGGRRADRGDSPRRRRRAPVDADHRQQRAARLVTGRRAHRLLSRVRGSPRHLDHECGRNRCPSTHGRGHRRRRSCLVTGRSLHRLRTPR